MKRRTIGWILRGAVAAAAVYLLARKLDWSEVRGAAARLEALPVLGLLALSYALIWTSCMKWRLFLRARGIAVPMAALVRLYVVGYFFNTFLPGNVGGDVVRSYALGRSLRNQADAFGTVFLERFTGFIALIGLGVAAGLSRPALRGTPYLGLFLAAMAALFVAMVAVLVFAPLQRFALRSLERFPDRGAPKKLKRFLQVVFHFRDRPDILGRAMAWSVAFHALTIVNVQVACWAFGETPRLLDLAAAVPMVLLVSSVPVSLAALGILEGAYVFFLSRIGLTAAAAMAVALLLRAKTLLLALLGGLLFAARRDADAANPAPGP